MKNLKRSVLILFLLISLSFNISCDLFTPIDHEIKVKKEAWDVIIEAHAVKQLWFHNFFRINSNNYKRGQLFIYEPTQAQINKLYDDFEELMSYADAVEAAVDSLEFLSTNTFAKPIISAGIFSALKDFFTGANTVKENYRKRIVFIAAKMSKEERDSMYRDIVHNKWQKEIGTADQFWSKLQSGDLDDKTTTLFRRFYEAGNFTFGGYASWNNMTPGKTLSKEGIDLCNKGFDVVLETGKLIVPGLGEATDLLEAGKNFNEKCMKMVDKPLEFVADEIKSRAINKVADMIDIDSNFDPDGVGKYVKILAETSLGSDDPAELIEKGINAGIAKITSTDNSIRPDIAIAKNSQGSTGLPDYIIGLGNYISKSNAYIMNLPEGNWDISVRDNHGQSSAPKRTSIISQQETVLDIKEIQQETGALDSLMSLLHSVEPEIQIFLYTPKQRISINSSTLRDTLIWSGKTFSMNASFETTPSETAIRFHTYELQIDGSLTMVSHDEVGLNLSAHYTATQKFSNSREIKYLDVQDIQIQGIPSSGFYSGYFNFEISPNKNYSYLNNIENIVTYSFRDVTYGNSNLSSGDISSDTTYTEFDDVSRSSVRVAIGSL